MSDEAARTGEIAPAHRFNAETLRRYLAGATPGADGFGGALQVRQFQGGASNPTFLLTTQGSDGERRYVLRKKPPGPLLASAHQVEREFRIMSALAASDVPVPAMRLLCEDPEVIGTPFYVMDFLAGRIFRDARLPGLSPPERAAIYDQLNDTLAKLHAVDFEAIGLGDFGRAGGYFERQIARWTRQYRGAQTEEIPAMEALIGGLPARIPVEASVSIAHGDYRLENTMFALEEPRLIAVLDWELSTIGHPLADLGYNAFLWRSHGEGWGTLDGVDFASSGIPDEAAYVEAYCRRTGRGSIEDWPFYLAFSIFRLASISQGVYRRVLDGTVASTREAANGTAALAETALGILEDG